MSNNMTHTGLVSRSNYQLDRVYRWLDQLNNKFNNKIPVTDRELTECSLYLNRMRAMLKAMDERAVKLNERIYRIKNNQDSPFSIPLY